MSKGFAPQSDLYADISIIGDELHFDGHLVAVMAEGLPATVQDRFGYLFRYGEDVTEDEKFTAEQIDLSIKVQAEAKKYARGGLLKLTDLAIILGKLKEME